MLFQQHFFECVTWETLDNNYLLHFRNNPFYFVFYFLFLKKCVSRITLETIIIKCSELVID